jgi:hypothetical protein
MILSLYIDVAGVEKGPEKYDEFDIKEWVRGKGGMETRGCIR